ncbi:unnamed protein product [Meloidogyne enterolobii]|uniref:Uncharacterized protein n=1 Tax=Meloidogyne enterolobii TaxID=390850 RepID=A0ACB1A2W9_MELEN
MPSFTFYLYRLRPKTRLFGYFLGKCACPPYPPSSLVSLLPHLPLLHILANAFPLSFKQPTRAHHHCK